MIAKRLTSLRRDAIPVFIVLMAALRCLAADPVLIAHRGLLRHAPENTLPAFATCLELGISFELDIRMTKDGQLVVLHDDSLARTTNGGNRSIRDVTLAEAQKLDAGSWFSSAFAGQPIPTLQQTLALVRERKRGPTVIALNVKHLTPAGEDELVNLVENYGMLDESFAFDQTDEMSRRLKKLNPRFRIGQNVKRDEMETRLNEGLLDVYLLTFSPTAKEVMHLHSHDKQVLFNDAGSGPSRRSEVTWKQVHSAAVDGMLTDYPLECRRVWRESSISSSNK